MIAYLLQQSAFDAERILVLLPVLACLGCALYWLPLRTARRIDCAWRSLTPFRYAIVGGGALAALALGYALAGVPRPAVMDEFSYLLAADTFASGRLTNPPHPLARFFEAPYVLQHPVYGSFYQPGQGLVLALGQLLGHPWIGVALSAAALALLVVWSLDGWMPPVWAMTAGILSIPLLDLGYWARSYWGGAVAACGGALLLGAVGRFRRAPQGRWAAAAAAGGCILLATRPAEGVPLALAAGGYLFFCGWRARRLRALLAGLAVAAAGVAAQSYYKWRVTGDAARLPYAVGLRNQVSRRMFVWQRPRPDPPVPHPYLADVARMHYRSEWTGFARFTTKYGPIVNLFGGSLWALPLLFAAALFRDRRLRPLFLLTATVLAMNLVTEWVHPHYAAPATVGLLAILVTSLRHLRTLTWARAAVPAVVLAVLVLTGAARAARLSDMSSPDSFGARRARLADRLAARDLPQLVIVRYGPRHWVHDDWVYNRADIDRAQIVWARDYGDESNRELLAYFGAREAWRWEPDEERLTPLLRWVTLEVALPERDSSGRLVAGFLENAPRAATAALR